MDRLDIRHDGDGDGDDHGDGDEVGDEVEDGDGNLTPPSSSESVLQCMFAGSDSKEQSLSITTLPLEATSDDDYEDDLFIQCLMSDVTFCDETSKIVGFRTSFHLARLLVRALALCEIRFGNKGNLKVGFEKYPLVHVYNRS